MTTVNLRHNSGTATDQKTMVVVGDSITVATASPYTMSTDFQRPGDLIARSLATRGVLRYNYGYFDDTSPLYRGWTRNGTKNGALSGAFSEARSDLYTIAQLKANQAALASTYDVVYQQVAYSGTTAGGTTSGNPWTTCPYYTRAASGFGDRIDYLFTCWMTNDYSADSAAQYQANLEARLNDWTNCGYKAVLISWLAAGTPFQQNFSADAHYAAAVAAAAAANPGDKQHSIPVVSLLPNGVLSSPDDTATYNQVDNLHLIEGGGLFHYRQWRPAVPMLSPWGRG